MKSNRDDFRVFEESSSRGTLWRIRIGGSKGTIVCSFKTPEEATEKARRLNIDPWDSDRGFTRKDRAAR